MTATTNPYLGTKLCYQSYERGVGGWNLILDVEMAEIGPWDHDKSRAWYFLVTIPVSERITSAKNLE